MLGRLEMDVDTCIQKYIELSAAAFQTKRMKRAFLWKVKDFWNVHGKYSAEAPTPKIKKIVESYGGGVRRR
jgi:hypothetical protein